MDRCSHGAVPPCSLELTHIEPVPLSGMPFVEKPDHPPDLRGRSLLLRFWFGAGFLEIDDHV